MVRGLREMIKADSSFVPFPRAPWIIGFDSSVVLYVAGLLAYELEAHPDD
jgi:hypothetical protein